MSLSKIHPERECTMGPSLLDLLRRTSTKQSMRFFRGCSNYRLYWMVCLKVAQLSLGLPLFLRAFWLLHVEGICQMLKGP